MNNTYLMRSLMFVPAHNQKLLDSAVRRDADVLLLDIEDSVPFAEKQLSRDNIKNFVKRPDLHGKLLFPRVNDRESGELLRDAYQLTIDGIAGFMYPKATKGDDIYFFGKLLETIEYEKGFPIGTFKIIPLIETAGAVINIKDICSACTRVIAVAFGCEDYVTDMGGKHDAEGISITTARNMICIGARSCGPLVNRYYSPTEDEVAWAEEMITLSEEAVSEGKGVAVKDNKFIGPPMVKMARNIIRKHELIVLKEKEFHEL